MSHQWNIVTYDVWGNEEDGFEVNDSFGAGSIELEDEEHFDDGVLLLKLIEAKYLDENVEVEDLTFDGDENVVYVGEADSGRPICSLQRDLRWG